MMTVSVSTRKWELSHGRQLPRGRQGWGAWGFDIGGVTEWVQGTFTEARRAAVKIAEERGETRVEVLP